MCSNTKKTGLLGITIVFLLAGLLVFATAASAETVKIDYPSFYRTAAVLPGGTLTIKVLGITGEENISLYLVDAQHVYELSYNVSGKVTGGVLLKTMIPSQADPSLYDIILRVNGETYRSPRAVRVYDSWPGFLRIAHVTDSHVGLINSNGVPAENYYGGELALIQLLGSDVIFGTGDLVDVGGNVNQYNTLLKYTNAMPLPSILMPGNHEYSGDASLDNWHALMGENFYVDRWGPYLFIAIDSGAEGSITPNELHWLQQVLEENKDAKIKIMGFHHPIFATKYVANVTGSYKNIELLTPHMYASWAGIPETTAELLRLIEEYNVTAVFNGHVHADGLVLYNGKTWFITTTAAGGPVRTGDYHGIRIVDIYLNGTVKIHTCSNCELWSDHAALNAEKARGTILETPNAIVYSVSLDNYDEIMQYARGDNITLGIRLSVDKIPGNSTLYVIGSPKPLEKIFVENQYVAEAKAVLPKTSTINIRLVLSPVEDKTPPSVQIASISPKKPIMGRSRVDVTVKAQDTGWGIMNVKIEYRLPNGQVREAVIYPLGSGYYKARLPVLKVDHVDIRAVAYDIAGLNSTTDWIRIEYAQPTTTTQTTQPTTTTIAQTTTTTTLPSSTTTTATTTTTPTSTPTTTQTSSPETPAETTATGGGGKAVYIGGAVIAVIVIAALAVLYTRR